MAGMGMMGGGMGMMGGMGGASGGMGGGSGFATPPSSGKAAVDLAQRVADLKMGPRAEASEAVRMIAGHRFQKVGDAWVDQQYKPSDPTVRLRVFGKAYFRLLAAHPEIKAILALGDHVTWVSPSGTALVIDKQAPDDAPDAGFDRLFAGS
jgi:Ca-activated chloride channel family protein